MDFLSSKGNKLLRVDSNVLNDFDIEKMQEMLSDLFDIGCDEDEKERKREEKERKRKEVAKRLEKLGEVGEWAGVLVLAGMEAVAVIALLSELQVQSNNETINREINAAKNELLEYAAKNELLEYTDL